MNVYTTQAPEQAETPYLNKGYQKTVAKSVECKRHHGRVYVKSCDFSKKMTKSANRLLLCKILLETIFTLGLCWLSLKTKGEWRQFKTGIKCVSLYVPLLASALVQNRLKSLVEYNVNSFVEPELLNNREFMLEAVAIESFTLAYASDAIRNDRVVVMKAVSKNPWVLPLVSQNLKKDKTVVLKAVSQDGRLLKYASEKLKDDKEVVLAAVVNSAEALSFASYRLRADDEVADIAIKSNEDAIEYLSERIAHNHYMQKARNAEKLIINQKEALQELHAETGFLLRCPELLSNIEFMHQAVLVNKDAFKYAPVAIRSIKKVALEAVTYTGKLLHNVASQLINDRDVVQAAINQDGNALRYAPDIFRDDESIVFSAENIFSEAMPYTSDRLRGDRQFLLRMLTDKKKHVRSVLEFATDALRSDKELVLLSIEKGDTRVLIYASTAMKNDPEVILKALQFSQNKIMLDPMQFASAALRKNREFVKKAVAINGHSLRYVHESFQDDKEIVTIAVKQYPGALHCASDVLKKDPDLHLLELGKYN